MPVEMGPGGLAGGAPRIGTEPSAPRQRVLPRSAGTARWSVPQDAQPSHCLRNVPSLVLGMDMSDIVARPPRPIQAGEPRLYL